MSHTWLFVVQRWSSLRQLQPTAPRSVQAGAGGSGGEEQQHAARGDWPSEYGYAHESEGGLRIIDDAEFPAAAAAAAARPAADRGGGFRGGGGRAAGAPPVGWDRQRGTQRAQRAADDFPSLAAVAAAEGSGGGGGGGAVASGSKAPPLVKKTAKCPCGRCGPAGGKAGHAVLCSDMPT